MTDYYMTLRELLKNGDVERYTDLENRKEGLYQDGKLIYGDDIASESAIKEIINELNKKPIVTEVLNTRVDTARDLVFKLFTQTKEMMKTAMFAEMAIVYGNRYRSDAEELDKNLSYSEVLFHKGEYQKSLEVSINALNRIEPGIYDKLLKLYENE